MPALILFNRRTIFAGDDLQPTSVITSFAHLSQFFLLVLPIFIHMVYEAKYILSTIDNDDLANNFFHYLFGNGDIFGDYEECNSYAHYFPLFTYFFLFCSTIHILCSLIFEYVIFNLSSIGNPTQPELRNPLLAATVEKKWIWLNILGNIGVLSIGITALILSKMYFNCRDGMDDDLIPYSDVLTIMFGKHAWWFAFILLLTSEAIELIVSSLALITLLSKKRNGDLHSIDIDGGSEYSAQNHDESYTHHELVEEMWTQRCQLFCKCAATSTCYLFGGKDLVGGIVGDYTQVSRALADYFEDGGVLDIVPSDIAAGFMMLQRRQRQRVLAARRSINDDLKNGTKQVKDVPLPSLRENNSSCSLSSLPANNDNMSNSSSISFDTHNFGSSAYDRKVRSFLNHDVDSENVSIDFDGIALYQNTSLQSQHHVNELKLKSILQPMPYTRTLLLPDGQLTSNSAAKYMYCTTKEEKIRK